MKTWKNFASDEGSATTQWVYDTVMGTLHQKIHPDNTAMTYTYTPAGRLASRVAARGVSTSYGYNNAGELESVSYSDDTEGVTTQYNRLGQPVQVSKGAQTRQATYSAVGQWMAEEVTSGELSGLKLTAELDALGRQTQIKATLNNVVLTQMDYDYDLASRLKSISNFQAKVGYTYAPMSNLPESRQYSWGRNAVLNTLFSHDFLNRNTAMASYGVNSNLLKQQNTEYNLANQRSKVGVGNGQSWDYSYDSLGQLSTANKVDVAGTAVPGMNFNYQFDDIGNRKLSAESNITREYQTNIVNQITALTGAAAPSYDLDGNLSNDGTWSYVWDGENRLLAQVGANLNLSFRYDDQGRRISKKVYALVNGEWMLQKSVRFVYHNWNLIAELDGNNAVLKTYTWGTDLSGSMQGAGGVGGLLCMTDHVSGSSYFYLHDGNGNVVGLVDAVSGSLVKEYEYGPFGKVLVESGSATVENHLKFSTKYEDVESGLLYYGYRSYSSELGRWISRDPIGERGGVNLYGFVGNDPIGWIDPVGLKVMFVPKGYETLSAPEKELIITPEGTKTDITWGLTRWKGTFIGKCDCKKLTLDFIVSILTFQGVGSPSVSQGDAKIIKDGEQEHYDTVKGYYDGLSSTMEAADGQIFTSESACTTKLNELIESHKKAKKDAIDANELLDVDGGPHPNIADRLNRTYPNL